MSVRSQQGTVAQTSVQQSTTHSQPMRSLTTGKECNTLRRKDFQNRSVDLDNLMSL